MMSFWATLLHKWWYHTAWQHPVKTRTFSGTLSLPPTSCEKVMFCSQWKGVTMWPLPLMHWTSLHRNPHYPVLNHPVQTCFRRHFDLILQGPSPGNVQTCSLWTIMLSCSLSGCFRSVRTLRFLPRCLLQCLRHLYSVPYLYSTVNNPRLLLREDRLGFTSQD